MRHGACRLSAVVLACLAAGGPPAAGAGRTAVRIEVWPQGRSGRSVVWTLACAPARGTLPDAARACHRLAVLRRPFAPVPRDAVCLQVYGGPQEAFVRGTYRGSRIWTWFQRRNSCETARWNRVVFLFPRGSRRNT